MHKRVGGGHYLADITARKVLQYWWPTLHRDAQQHCQSCDVCKQTGNLLHTLMAKFITMLLAEPFMKWALDFIGLIKLVSRSHGNNTF
jgi:hypothetical protein